MRELCSALGQVMKAQSDNAPSTRTVPLLHHPPQVRMGELCSALGQVMGRPSLVPVPDFALRTLLGEVSMGHEPQTDQWWHGRKACLWAGQCYAGRWEGRGEDIAPLSSGDSGGSSLPNTRSLSTPSCCRSLCPQCLPPRLLPATCCRARRWCWRGSG